MSLITNAAWQGLIKRPAPGGATTIAQIDVGRTSGGTVSGWEQESGITGTNAIETSYSAQAIATTGLTNPPTQSALQIFRYAGTGESIIWTRTGLNNVPHTLYFWAYDDSANAATFVVEMDVTVNSVLAYDNFNVYTQASNTTFRAVMGTVVVTPSSGTITATFAPSGNYAYLSAIRLVQN